MRFFFLSVLYRNFATCSSFDIHTSRLRKKSRNRRKRMFETFDLKFFSVHSSKSFRYSFHKFSSMRLSFFHSLIFVWTNRSANTKAKIMIDLRTRKRRSFSCWEVLWLRSSFARVMTCEIERCSDCEAILQEFSDLQILYEG